MPVYPHDCSDNIFTVARDDPRHLFDMRWQHAATLLAGRPGAHMLHAASFTAYCDAC